MKIVDHISKKTGKVDSYRSKARISRKTQNGMESKFIFLNIPAENVAGLTPSKRTKELQRQFEAWKKREETAYKNSAAIGIEPGITLPEFVNSIWINDHVLDGTHTPATIDFYKARSRTICEYLGNIAVRDIDLKVLKKFLKRLRNSNYSATTQQHIYRTLNNILQLAQRYKLIPENPCRDLTPKETPHREKKNIDFLSVEQARQYLALLDQENIYWKAFEYVLIFTGVRRGEAVALQWSDIDFAQNIISISKSVAMDKTAKDINCTHQNGHQQFRGTLYSGQQN